MKLFGILGVTVVALFALPLVLCGVQDEKPKKAEAGSPKADAKPVSIPKDAIYTTSSEGGFKKRLRALFHSKDDKPVFPYSYHLKIIAENTHGASNVCLVRGADITEAVKGTRLVFAGTQGADKPRDRDFDDKKFKGDKIWLVVYLGTGWSTPPRWEFKAASIHNQTVEFRYRMDDPMISTNDNIQYFYWVPLPPLKQATYELKLVEADKGRPALIRYVDVP